MIRKCLLRPNSSKYRIEPSQDDMTVAGVFNPGAVRVGKKIYLLVRVAEGLKRPTQDKKHIVFPRAVTGCRRQPESGYRIEPMEKRAADYVKVDNRGYKTKREGWTLLTSISHFRLVKVELDSAGKSPRSTFPTSRRFIPRRITRRTVSKMPGSLRSRWAPTNGTTSHTSQYRRTAR